MRPKAYYSENDKFAAAWLRELIKAKLIADGDVDDRSIADVRPGDLAGYTQCHFFAGIGGWSYALRLAGWPDEREVWTGSCPCQPFSQAGRRDGESDKRHLWPFWLPLIAQRSPTVVFGEQVASSDGLSWFDEVACGLEDAHYAVAAADLCAASVGAPQIRQRLWFVADSNGQGRKGHYWKGESGSPREKRTVAHSEPMRPVERNWPEGPGAVDAIPMLANGLPGVVGACKGYGNAIVPQVAAEFIAAYMDCASPRSPQGAR